jgi:hypothetical protein
MADANPYFSFAFSAASQTQGLAPPLQPAHPPANGAFPPWAGMDPGDLPMEADANPYFSFAFSASIRR